MTREVVRQSRQLEKALPKWSSRFLAALAESPSVSHAAKVAGVGRATVYEWRERCPELAKAWDDAIEQSTDALVQECYRRAQEGTEKPVFHRGEVCGSIREYSDTLAIFLLKSHRPSVYRETVRQEHTGSSGGPILAEMLHAAAKVYGDPSPGQPAIEATAEELD